MKIAVINGPNINLLGLREPSIYGDKTLKEINEQLSNKALIMDCEIEFFQSNSEGEIVDYIQLLREKDFDGLIINAAAYTHTSIAIRDALLTINIPFVEVHISNIFKRESFRYKSYLSDISVGVVSGLGYMGYEYALDFLVKALKRGEIR